MKTNNKLRDALEDATWLLESILEAFSKGTGGVYTSDVAEAIDNARAALDEPVLNSEMGTPEEQVERWGVFCNRYDDDCTGCPCDAANAATYTNCFAQWEQMPYVENEEVDG
jgi:hypothetical protein